jgi:signal transduction histidine kinase
MSSFKRWLKLTKGASQSDTDWAICLVRWGLFVAILVVALLDPARQLSPVHLALFLVAYGAYNLTITALLAIGFLTQAVPAFTLAVDTLAMLLLVYLSGGVDSPFALFPLFPILVATVRFNWLLGLITAAIFVLGLVTQMLLGWERDQGVVQVYPVVLQSLLFFLVTAAGAVLNRRPPAHSLLIPADWADNPLAVPDSVKMIYEMASTLSATLNYERVLEAILDISRLGFDELGQRMGESVGLVLLYDRDGFLYVASHRNLVTQKDEMLRLAGKAGIVEEAIASAQAIIGGAPSADAELRTFQSLKSCKSMICVPLRAGFETYGAVLFASTRRDVYTTKHVDLLTIFCNQATIALQNANLYQTLRQERDKIIDKEEDARHKLARDLHDGPTQDVSAIAMRLNFARLLMERDSARARVELEKLEDLAHRTVREIRSMLFALRPVVLETEGLLAALNQYTDNLRESDDLPIDVDAEGYQDCLDIETQGVVFAIIEEAVNNARKHAEASRILVRLSVQDDLFVAQVIDNGRGFDLNAVEADYGSRGSLGLVNLRERAGLVEGNVTIDSEPGGGTSVTLVVPIVEEPV